MAFNRRTPAKLEYTNVFTAIVGAEEEKFVVHGSIATPHSKFFEAACTGKFKESQEKLVRLPEVNVKTFSAYMQWLYSGDVVVVEPEDFDKDKPNDTYRAHLVALYGLADMLMDLPLQNKVMDKYIHSCDAACQGPPPKDLAQICDNLPSNCTLRRFAVDWYVYYIGLCEDWLQDNKEALPVPFALDLLVGIAEADWTRPPGPFDQAKCKYHEHNEGAPECAL